MRLAPLGPHPKIVWSASWTDFQKLCRRGKVLYQVCYIFNVNVVWPKLNYRLNVLLNHEENTFTSKLNALKQCEPVLTFISCSYIYQFLLHNEIEMLHAHSLWDSLAHSICGLNYPISGRLALGWQIISNWLLFSAQIKLNILNFAKYLRTIQQMKFYR